MPPDREVDPAISGPSAGEGVLKVGYVGHLYQGRGIDLLIELARRCPWLHMHIVGGEPEDVLHWKEASRDLHNVTLHGYVKPAETVDYRRMCDVLAAPYQQVVKVAGNQVDTSKWMSPLKIFEYMATGKAIVCSDLPVLREVLTDGENALLCKADDVDAWCAAMERLRGDVDLRLLLGERAYRDYVENYTWEQRAARLLSVFGAQ
jgi:glycosyltransferase involved in cell wall biosynthesis